MAVTADACSSCSVEPSRTSYPEDDAEDDAEDDEEDDEEEEEEDIDAPISKAETETSESGGEKEEEEDDDDAAEEEELGMVTRTDDGDRRTR